MRFRPHVLSALASHGIAPDPGDTVEALRGRLKGRYLDDVRRLKERRVAGQIPPREYAAHVQMLRERYPLLGLPISLLG